MNNRWAELGLAALGAVLSMAVCAAPGKPARQSQDSSRVFAVDHAKENAVRVAVRSPSGGSYTVRVFAAGTNEPVRLDVGYPRGGNHKNGVLTLFHEDISYSAYCRLVREKKPLPPATAYSNAFVRVEARDGGEWFNLNYSMLPYFGHVNSLHRYADVAANIGRWLKEYPLFPERTLTFEFRHNAVRGRIEGYLDGNYCGEWEVAGGLDRVEVESRAALEVSGGGYAWDASDDYALPPIPNRANDALRSGAKLVLDPKYRDTVFKAMTVWEPALSVDQGAHKSTHAVRELTSDPQSRRTPFLTGPEFMQWMVPNGFYRTALVLCADLPQMGRVPTVGFNMTRFGTSNVGSRMERFVSLDGAATNRDIVAVGSLEYLRDGRTEKTPLYLVKVRLDPFSILPFINDLRVYGKDGRSRLPRMMSGSYLDVEFVGAGTLDDLPRSSVQVFGCTLQKMDYSVVMDQSVRGNLFERGTDRPETGVRVTAERDGASGTVRYEVYGPLFKVIDRGEKPFRLAKRGDTERLSFDLERKDVGWYGVDFTFLDAKGGELGRHEASYTILAPDDREAGVESPYACWPLGGGYHNSDPNRRQQAEVMRKAGYRTSWQPPVTNENEFGFPLGLSSVGQGKGTGGGHFLNPCKPCSAAALSNRLDEAVAHFRARFAAFPGCRYIQLLHEQGGRDVAPCLYDGEPHPRGEYRGIDGDWTVYYATEYAKRMRREFPDRKIFIGNGSVSSELIAGLVENGFDLSLVDQLGIESKGFGTMPELAAHREAPGCLWALKETGRYFGYSNLTLNACNEYVFRPERRVGRDWPREKVMRRTDYTVRDYLLSLAHGCGIISTGHLEDCNDQYYDTNWGAGGQCTFYPFSYPKRMYTALSVFTRVFDKATLSRRVPTGGNSTYALEFRRDRRTKDFAYAFWTPEYGVPLEAEFPKGARVKWVDVWGVETGRETRRGFTAGATPTYCISDLPVETVRIVAAKDARGADRSGRLLCPANLGALEPCTDEKMLKSGCFCHAYGTPDAIPGEWEMSETDDPGEGKVVRLHLKEDATPAPAPFIAEVGLMKLRKPIRFEGGEKAKDLKFAVKMFGNGSFGYVQLAYSPVGPGGMTASERKYMSFDGWQTFELGVSGYASSGRFNGRQIEITHVVFATCRKALNPMEMVPVENDIRFGGIYEAANTAAGTLSLGDRKAAEVMLRDVEDKDL